MASRKKRIVQAVVHAAAFVVAWASIAAGQPSTAKSACNQPAPTAVAIVKLPGHPFSIVPSYDGCWLFVSLTSVDPRSNGVAVLRRSAGTITVERLYPIEAQNRAPLRPGPSGMVMTHDGQLLIAANDDEVVFLDVPSMISGKPDPVVGHLSDGHSAGSFYANVTKDDAHLFVSDEYAETITVIDLAKARRTNYDQSAIVGKIPVGILSISLKFSPDEQWLYTTSERAPASWNWPIACPPDRQDRAKYPNPEVPEGGVIVVNVRRAFSDPATAVVAKAPAGCSPVRLAISGKGDLIWVSARRSDAVLGFDTSKLRSDPLHARIGSVTVGTAPVGIAVLPDSKHVVVANSNRIAANPNGSETVSVIDMDKVRAGRPAVVGTIPAGAFPREFSQSSDKRTLFLGNYLSDTLEVIDLKKLSVIAK